MNKELQAKFCWYSIQCEFLEFPYTRGKKYSWWKEQKHPVSLVRIVPNLSQAQLLTILDADPGRAEEKYHELFQQLLRYFEWNRSLAPEDLAQEALKRGFARLQEGAQITTDDPRGFFFGIARNLIREGWRTRNSDQLEPVDQERVQQSKPLYNLVNSEQGVFLQECLRGLSDEEFKMLMAYVEGEGRQWAQQAGTSLSTLHTRVHRLRRRWKSEPGWGSKAQFAERMKENR